MRPVILYAFTLILVAGLIIGCSQKQPTTSNSANNQAASGSSKVKTDENATAKAPSFRGLIKNVSLYGVPGRSNDLAVTLVVTVANSGSPSVLTDWKLEVNSPAKGVPTGMDAVHINGVVDLPGSETKTVDLAKEDLALKTISTPVAAGAQISGVLTFVLPNTVERQIAHNSTSLMVHFKDAQGHSYWTPKTFIGEKAAAR